MLRIGPLKRKRIIDEFSQILQWRMKPVATGRQKGGGADIMESMQAIDVHDLPEPVAQAIAAMVESLRSTGRAAPHNGSDTTVGQILESVLNSAPIDADAPVHPHRGQESEIAEGIIEKFRRQGLKL